MTTPYTQNQKSTGLDSLTDSTITQSDLHIVGDVSDSGFAKTITQNLLEDYIANSTNFIGGLTANSTFIASLITEINTTGDTTVVADGVTITGTGTTLDPLVAIGGGGSGGSGGTSGKPMTFALLGEGGSVANGYQDRESLISYGGMTIRLQDTTGKLQSRVLTTDWAGADTINGYALIGSYLYVLLQDAAGGGLARIYRFTASDLSLGGTNMTISGASLTYGINLVMTSNGTELFINYDAGNSANSYAIAGFTISGTTATYVATVTCGSTTAQFSNAFAVNNNGDYYGFNGSIQTFYRYNSAGTLQYTSPADTGAARSLLNWGNTIYVVNADDIYTKIYLPNTDVSTSADIQTKTVTLSSADILGLGATPIELIQAPGANKIIIIENVIQNFTAGTQYSGGNHEIVYSGDSTPITEPLVSYNSATSYVSRDSGADSNDITVGINTAVDIQGGGGTYTGGTGTVTLIIQYSIINL